ncbi:MAG: hypothetical protein ABFD54_00890 [Armatimonadota bacterium]|nr:hypothetical protein [bacterium]
MSTSVVVDASKKIGVVGDLYNAGYNGWGDITNRGMVEAFKQVGVKYYRIDVNMGSLCGAGPGEYDWNYNRAADLGIGFTDRVKLILKNGWVPILAFWYHDRHNALPKWFHGENHDRNQDCWTRYNMDGSKVSNGCGDQLAAATRIAQDVATHFASQGLAGLHYETIYEMDCQNPLIEIHHAVALGVRKGDSAAKIIGPATWPGYAIEDGFIKPYLAKYGPDLLDMVSIHWYGSNYFTKLMKANNDDMLTMADVTAKEFLMRHTTDYHDWTASIASLFSDKSLNPTGKHFGIIYTEIDVDAASYYLKNPENPNWPKYCPETDCCLNNNYFGGVWWASVLCNIASTGATADACLYNGRGIFGIQEVLKNDKCYRYPLWFAFKLLRERGGLYAGRQMLNASVPKSEDKMLEVFATGGSDDLSVIIINKSESSRSVNMSLSGLMNSKWSATRYLYDRTTVAQFRGRKPGDQKDGTYEGFPESDSLSERCCKPVDVMDYCEKSGYDISCPPVSFTILDFNRI